MLELKNVKKSFKTADFTQIALNDVSLKFRKSEFVAVLGPSGSGKTTLLNIIGGLDRYDSGDLIINGKSTKEFKDRDWDAYRNNCVGFIFQSYNLITHISVLENVKMCMTLSGVSNEEKTKKAYEVLEKVGLKDHANKKPNQLSGGQMQRVAIARALANDPDIILADEPTGALDSNTSVQIMELIKDIAKDKLVIMVTHNPELAKEYANRIIDFKDGVIVNDSNSITDDEKDSGSYSIKRTAMNFFTALKLSFTNISTKKGRTILTAFASSIGIIGIAIVLSLSNGFNDQIDIFETNTLASFPIIISEQTIKVDKEKMMEKSEEMLQITTNKSKKDAYPDVDVAYPYNSKENTIIHTNVLSEDYIKYIEGINPSLVGGISYMRIAALNLFNEVNGNIKALNSSAINFSSLPKVLDGDSNKYLEQGYDLLAGKLPENKTQILIQVDKKNRIEKTILELLGIDASENEIKLEKLVGYKIKMVLNDNYYISANGHYFINTDIVSMYSNPNNLELEIVGVVRGKEDNKISAMTTMINSASSTEEVPVGAILYCNELIEEVIKKNSASPIALAQKEVDYNILTGVKFNSTREKNNVLNYFGAEDIPVMISIYPNDFSDKSEIIKYLDKYNENKGAENQIVYNDMAEEVSSMSESIMDGITIVLVAFSAVSLVVSTIMIAIITYISVLERTKEIGILRALGARKKDITRVFNAETFIIGIFSGMLGIGITCLLIPLINKVLYNLTDLTNVAKLNPLHAILLITISVILTLIGGWIPAKMAAKKDPVEALRTE